MRPADVGCWGLELASESEPGDWEEEKKRKAKAIEEPRKMQAVRRRKIKRKFLVEGLGGELGLFVSDRRRAVEGFWESSSSGAGVGFDGPRMEREAVPMMGIFTSLSLSLSLSKGEGVQIGERFVGFCSD
eukprot:TRINITY_DN7168_c0_g2_i3.p1 TRINITY_DN7168_c0_g2~~TRINITY_DN7168_c0_g2_i3.p1  ORF type:complete len:130 (-),score=44.75 TRINITY_DN7168_c0_g2_i3:158-547(-)